MVVLMEEAIEENKKDVEKEIFSEEGQKDMDGEEQIEEGIPPKEEIPEEEEVSKEEVPEEERVPEEEEPKEEESKQQIKIKSRRSLNDYDKIILAIGITIHIIIAGTYIGFRGREDNPFAFITDSDGDGYTDHRDAFINDPSEWWDWDEDGIGNNADIWDFGDAGIQVFIFKYIGEEGAFDEGGAYDPYFIIYFDYEGDEDWDASNKSEVYENATLIYPYFEYIINVKDDLESIRFAVVVMDEDFLTDDDYIDYTNESSSTWYIHKFIPLPDHSGIDFIFNGEEDGVLNEEDCYIEYWVQVVILY